MVKPEEHIDMKFINKVELLLKAKKFARDLKILYFIWI